MKLNKKGFAISTIMYIMLVLALLIVVATLGLLSARKITLDKLKNTVLNDIKTKLNTEEKYDSYSVGDVINYNEAEYVIIKPSNTNQNYITVLKQQPLTVQELTDLEIELNEEKNDDQEFALVSFNDIKNFENTNINEILKKWQESLNSEDLLEIDGYKVRLVKVDELTNELECSDGFLNTSLNNISCSQSKYKDFIFNSSYNYWTMISNDSYFYGIDKSGNVLDMYNLKYKDEYYYQAIRPVVNILKSSIN